MNDAGTVAQDTPLVIALVHGIGAVHPHDMIRDITKALEPSLAGAEFHPWIKAIDTPGGIELCQKETRAGRSITVISAYWGDICKVGENVFSVLGGLLTNIFGLRYFISAALRGGGPLRHLLWFANILIVWVAAVVAYPLNFVALFYSSFLLAGQYISSSYASSTESGA